MLIGTLIDWTWDLVKGSNPNSHVHVDHMPAQHTLPTSVNNADTASIDSPMPNGTGDDVPLVSSVDEPENSQRHDRFGSKLYRRFEQAQTGTGNYISASSPILTMAMACHKFKSLPPSCSLFCAASPFSRTISSLQSFSPLIIIPFLSSSYLLFHPYDVFPTYFYSPLIPFSCACHLIRSLSVLRLLTIHHNHFLPPQVVVHPRCWQSVWSSSYASPSFAMAETLCRLTCQMVLSSASMAYVCSAYAGWFLAMLIFSQWDTQVSTSIESKMDWWRRRGRETSVF